ncbi:ATPase SWSAP1 isoform X1 [Nerophis lumbriciformis]|uniref:ATPase SWSAP1 isoform X1 n=1 Tax=Nerophis lumbriciformis TaxID=546530 RepID=UPI002ADF1693|nr:ATPase SWSAP1-like isoform X1 [Nerophis lumbriciformis]
MADVLTHMFANLSQADSKKDVVTPAPPECGVLIVGEQSLGRSLLLLTAVTAASQVGMKVVFFAPQQIQSLPASLQKCAPSLSPESLKKITFCYPRTAEELCRQIAGLHESSSTFPPSLIIVDRLEDYPCDGHSGRHPGEQSRVAHLAALLRDTAAFLTSLLERQTSSTTPCRIIASYKPKEDGADSDPVLDALDRYFQLRCTLDQDRSYKATDAGRQEAWRVYFSGTGVAREPRTEDSEVRAGLEWQLLMFPDGSIAFKVI